MQQLVLINIMHIKDIWARTEASHQHYRQVSNHVKSITKLSKNNLIHGQPNRLLNNPNDNKIFWSTLNSFNNNFNIHSWMPPLVSNEGKVISDSNSKAYLMSSIFRRSTTLSQSNNPLHQLHVQYPDITYLIIKTKDIGEIINGLNITKSAGSDELPAIVFKCCSHSPCSQEGR